jgi:hypothetical protein
MDYTKRQQQIRDRLRPKPIHHGQLEAFLIAVPDLKLEDIPVDRKQFLKDSLEQEGSNLIPLIVRRTEAYEEEEYEVVYGADWCLVAKEIDLERVWVWVFDLTDEQAIATRQEMELLTNSVPTSPNHDGQFEDSIRQINVSLQKVIKVPELMRESIPALVKDKIEIAMQELKQTLTQEIMQELMPVLAQFKQSLLESGQAGGNATVSYDRMLKAELETLARQRNLKVRSKMKKADLIALLEASDGKVDS